MDGYCWRNATRRDERCRCGSCKCRRGCLLGYEVADRWVVGAWSLRCIVAAEGEGAGDEAGGDDCKANSKVRVWEEVRGIFAVQDLCGTGEVEDVAGCE